MPKWTRRAEARPTELARAALELCSERGVQSTKVADVAERAGVTVGTVYRYFRDKDALIDAALALATLPAPKAPMPARPGAALPALADALRRWSRFFREAGARAVRVAMSDPERDASAPRRAIQVAIEELTSIISEGVTRGDLRADLAPPAVARGLVSALALGTVLGPLSGDGHADDDSYVEAIAALATRGMRPDGPSWRPATV